MRYRLTQTAPPQSLCLVPSVNHCLSHGPSLHFPSPHFLLRHHHPFCDCSHRSRLGPTIASVFHFQPLGTLTCLRVDDDDEHSLCCRRRNDSAFERAATDTRLNTIFRSISMLTVPDDELASTGDVTNPLPPQQRGGRQQHWLQTAH